MIINIPSLLFSSKYLPHINIHIFGLFSSIALIVFTITLIFDRSRHHLISKDHLLQLVTEFMLVAIIGAKLLFLAEHFSEFREEGLLILFSRGGFSLLGSFILLPPYIFFRMKLLNIPFLPVADLFAANLPIFQAIARLGCLFAGCCNGILTTQTTHILFVLYKHPSSFAPQNLPLIPLQLISAILSLCIFVVLRIWRNKPNHRPGLIFGYYLALEGLARFIVDFWRSGRNIIVFNDYEWQISSTQLIALGIILSSMFFILPKDKRYPKI